MAPDNGGFIAEYPLIRVDNFTGTLPPLPGHIDDLARQDLPANATHFAHPHILLLSHPHTDHLSGLSSISRHSAPIYCSQVTKDLLLALERKEDRLRYDAGKTPSRKRPYKHLRRTIEECRTLDRLTGTHTASAYDVLIALPFDKPFLIRYSATVQIRLTLLPANHMPGSAMFLIEGPRGAVLHTGDMRGETTFVRSLQAQTHLSRVANARSPSLLVSPNTPLRSSREGIGIDSIAVASCPGTPPATAASKVDMSILPKLITVYLDTERISDGGEPVERADAILDTIHAMKLFPSSTRFHVDCWTSGYEYFLLSAFKAFGDGKIYIDRYKSDLYAIMSRDQAFSDIHAICSTDLRYCGRLCACDEEACKRSCVLIEPRESLSKNDWRDEKRRLVSTIRAARQGRDTYPKVIPLPIQRHSPLPELYRMVDMLRPQHIVANTASPSARFICARMTEVLCLEGALQAESRHCLPPNRQERENDIEQWQNLSEVWASVSEADPDDDDMNVDAKFFTKVSRFRKAVWGQRKVESERLLCERLDAACDAQEMRDMLPDASASVLQPRRSVDVNGRTGEEVEKPWNAAGKYAATDTSPFMTAAMRRAGVTASSASALPAWPAPSGESPNQSIVKTDDQNIKPRLSTELASRYLAYAAMYLGWKIRNPSRYRQDVAWRAIRKIKPALAHETEDALQRELGWAIPPWDDEETNAKEAQKRVSTSPCERAAGDVMLKSVTPPPPSTPPLAPPEQANAGVPQTISPLELGRQHLAQRLANEAESQRLEFSDEAERDSEDGAEIDLTRTGDADGPEKCQIAKEVGMTDEDLTEAVRCLRMNNIVPMSVQGLQRFVQVTQEWETLSKVKNGLSAPCQSQVARLHDQLSIVGVAAYSRRARELLAWSKADYGKALRALRMLSDRCRVSNDHGQRTFRLPARHRVVLRYLRRASCRVPSPSSP